MVHVAGESVAVIDRAPNKQIAIAPVKLAQYDINMTFLFACTT
jgi:hypothetical protein